MTRNIPIKDQLISAFSSIIGSIYDYTQSYDVSFYLGGIFLFASAIIGFLVPSVRRLTMRLRKQAKETSNLSNSSLTGIDINLIVIDKLYSHLCDRSTQPSDFDIEKHHQSDIEPGNSQLAQFKLTWHLKKSNIVC